jgi:proteasome alpha subunit
MILAGVDATGPRVLTTDPSGAYRGFKAVAVGRKNDEANEFLEEQYSEDITLEGAIQLAIEAVKKASDSVINEETVKVAVVPLETKVFRRLDPNEIKSYLN